MNLKVDFERYKTGQNILYPSFSSHLFHDMHPEMFLSMSVTQNPKYAAVDFGIVGSLDEKTENILPKASMHSLRKIMGKLQTILFLPAGFQRRPRLMNLNLQLEPCVIPSQINRLKKYPSVSCFSDFLTARDFNMVNQPQLIQLEKTLLNIEGLGRQLSKAGFGLKCKP